MGKHTKKNRPPNNKNVKVSRMTREQLAAYKHERYLLSKVEKNNTNNTNNTNSHNKTFNLQFFLNEECKNALNISEFVSSIQVELEDLETTKPGDKGISAKDYQSIIGKVLNKNLSKHTFIQNNDLE